METVQLSRLLFRYEVAVLAADLVKMKGREEKVREAPKGDVVMMMGGSVMRERAVEASLFANVVRRIVW